MSEKKSMAGKKIVKVVVCKIFPRRPLQCVAALVIPEKYKYQFSNLKEKKKTISKECGLWKNLNAKRGILWAISARSDQW